eukprot:g7565.t2
MEETKQTWGPEPTPLPPAPAGASSEAAVVPPSAAGTPGLDGGAKVGEDSGGGGGGGGGDVGGGGGEKASAHGGGKSVEGAGKGKGVAAAAQAAVAGGSVGGGSSGSERFNWMPSLRRSNPSRECIRRVRNDIKSVMRDPVPGLFVCPDEDLVTVVHALVTGPFDTPYEGGFYYFVLHCPDDYPHNPPRVRLLTTGGGKVRFNPNLYANGKVCLSILGTWSGPSWSPVHSISSVLLSIQSLMSEKPYHNEPGFEEASNPQDVRDYNDCITHENLRAAVCSMVDDSSLWSSMPECFQALTRELFLSFVPRYELVCELHMHRDGEKLADPFGQNKGTFRYASIARSIKRIAATLEAEGAAAPSGSEEEPCRPEQDGAARSTQQRSVDAAAGGGGQGVGGGSRAGAGAFPNGAKGHGSGSSATREKEGGGGGSRSAFR